MATGRGSLENQEEEEVDVEAVAAVEVEGEAVAAVEVEGEAVAAAVAGSSPGGAGELLVDGLSFAAFAAAAVAAVIMPSSSLSSAIGEGGDLKPGG